MRGNQSSAPHGEDEERSIPAYAGEPPAADSSLPTSGVYPRVCGGTITRLLIGEYSVGLSPRMRGNPPHEAVEGLNFRSIPAYAGEPWSGMSMPYLSRVYPRVCGGTINWTPVWSGLGGLSPRMRGNPLGAASLCGTSRSIPAYAGEPRPQAPDPDGRPVYPRVCGGTILSQWVRSSSGGLSPRMRGNPLGPLVALVGAGSIPAYAGEPGMAANLHGPVGVYPRVCGGTSHWG